MGQEFVTFNVSVRASEFWKDTTSGALRFRGEASSPSVDRQKERFSERAVGRMAAADPVLCYPTHERLAGTELAKTLVHRLDGDRLYVEGEFFADNPQAQRIHERAIEGWEYEFSVGGKILAAYWEYNAEIGARVRVLDDIELNHIVIAAAGKAANPDTWLQVIGKTIDAAGQWEDPMPGDCQLVSAVVEKVKALKGDFDKAGSKHTAAEKAAIHSVIQSLREVCSCDACQAALAEVDEAGDDAAKSLSFAEALNSAEAQQEGYWDADVVLWPLVSLLTEVVAEILGTEGVDREALLIAALDEFVTAAIARLESYGYNAGKTAGQEGRTMDSVTKTDETAETAGGDIGAVMKRLDEMATQIGELTGKVATLTSDRTEAEQAAPQGAEKAEESAPADQDSGAGAGAGGGATEPPAQMVAPEDAGKTFADMIDAMGKTTDAIAGLTERLAAVTAKGKGGAPVLGGPTSTAAEEEATKTDDGKGDDILSRVANDVRAGAGTPAGAAARKTASRLVAGSVLLGLGAEPVDR